MTTPTPTPALEDLPAARSFLLRAAVSLLLALLAGPLAGTLLADLPSGGVLLLPALFRCALAIAVTGIALYLGTVWLLAAVVVSLGTERRVGATVLAALRVLAPATARRLVLGAATVSVLGSMAASPALAAPPPTLTHALDATSEASSTDPASLGVATLRSQEADPAHGRGVLTGGLEQELEDSPTPRESEAPSVGWTTPDPGHHSPGPDAERPGPDSRPSATRTPSSAPATDHEDAHHAPRVVIVRPGDTLWQIADDALGPGRQDPSAVARAVHRIHQRNAAVIGPDPDHIEPGQRLVLPLDLT